MTNEHIRDEIDTLINQLLQHKQNGEENKIDFVISLIDKLLRKFK